MRLPDRVKKQLADRGLMPEDWGGSTVFVDVSAKQKTNLNLLMEMICLVADLQDLKATPDRLATGTVLEAKLDRGRGPVATVLVQNGTLHTGDNFVVGNVFGKVRAMFNDRGARWKPPVRPLRSRFLAWKDCRRPATNWSPWPIAKRRATSPSIARPRPAKPRWPRARASRWKAWRSSSRLPAARSCTSSSRATCSGSVEVLSDLLTKLSNEQVKINSCAPVGRRHHRKRCAAGLGLKRHHHWLQRAAGAQGAGDGRAGEGRHPPALHHLRAAGRDQDAP